VFTDTSEHIRFFTFLLFYFFSFSFSFFHFFLSAVRIGVFVVANVFNRSKD